MGTTTIMDCWRKKVGLMMKVEKVVLKRPKFSSTKSAAVEMQLMGPTEDSDQFGWRETFMTKRVMFNGGRVAMIDQDFPLVDCSLFCVAKIFIYTEYGEGKKITKARVKAVSLCIGGLAAEVEGAEHEVERAIRVQLPDSSQAVLHLSVISYDIETSHSPSDGHDETSKRSDEHVEGNIEDSTDFSFGSTIKKRQNDQEEQEGNKKLESDVGWNEKEFKSKNGKVKLKTQTFFASFDQTSKRAGGDGACSALAVHISNWLLSNPGQIPTKQKLEDLIVEGSAKWRVLCKDPAIGSPDGFFQIDTLLKHKFSPISSTSNEYGIISLEKFESLYGFDSFDDIWDKALKSVNGKEQAVFIVGWKEHFFVIKLDANVGYLIDTLGDRLFQGNHSAYMLKFDANSRIELLGEERDGTVFEGRACLKEFVTRFLAGRSVTEIEKKVKKGKPLTMEIICTNLQVELIKTEKKVAGYENKLERELKNKGT